MQYYFGKINASEMPYYEDGTYFTYNGNHYNNKIEFGSNPGGLEEFVISDSIGRSVPLCVENIDSIIEILSDIKTLLWGITIGDVINRSVTNAATEHAVED